MPFSVRDRNCSSTFWAGISTSIFCSFSLYGIVNRRVSKGRGGGLFLSIEKKCSDIGKNVLIFRIYKLSFSFKRGGSRTAATSKMERKPLTIIAKRFILDDATALNPPLGMVTNSWHISDILLLPRQFHLWQDSLFLNLPSWRVLCNRVLCD